MTTIKISTNRVFFNNAPDCFVGRVKYYENGIYLWSESTDINRLDETTAIDDAKKIAQWRMETNCLPTHTSILTEII